MGISKLIPIAVSLAFLTVATGNLPKILYHVRVAQMKLVLDSQASMWPKAMRLK